jgi:xylulose-5-phosphate/fructose-6-phosphate phosphoketolase
LIASFTRNEPHPTTVGPSASPPSATRPAQHPAAADVSAVIRDRASGGSFRLFSPDEASSNRIRLTEGAVPVAGSPPWATEVLNEELCHAWLQGYIETGRDALLATYEAFAPVNLSLLVQHLKHRRLRRSGTGGLPSINYLITSLGWRNTYTHQNPVLAGAMLGLEDDSLHLYTPADATRAAAVLSVMLASRDRTNILITDKHPGPVFPPGTFRDELTRGAAHWPRHSWGRGAPDLVLASAGDVPARELTRAADRLRRTHPDARVRYVHINDLTVLGAAPTWPSALPEREFTRLFGKCCPVLLAAPAFPAPIQGLLASRPGAARFHVTGYRDPGGPTSPEDLLEHSGMSASVLSAQATALLKEIRG